MKRIIFVLSSLLALSANTQTYAQPANWAWATGGGSVGNDVGNNITTDKNGNVLITGSFTDVFSLGTTQLTSAGDKDIFIAKYNPSGQLLWAKSAGGSGADEGSGIATDALGNVYVSGGFKDSADFGTTHLVGAGDMDVFLAKYNANGNLLWVRSGGSNYSDYYNGVAVTVDAFDNVYMTGQYGIDPVTPSAQHTANFDNYTLTSAGSSDVFIVKYNSSGNVLWAKSAGGGQYDFATDIKTDNLGNVYISGNVDDNAYFDSKKLTSVSSGTSFTDGNMFIAKYDSSGKALWVNTAGGINNASNTWAVVSGGISLATDKYSNSYVVGIYKDCDLKIGGKRLKNIGDVDFYLAKYDSTGKFIWAKNAGGRGDDMVNGVTVDEDSYIYITGKFAGECFWPTDTLLCGNKTNTYVARYDKDGNETWSVQADADYTNKITADGNGNLYTTGYFNRNTASFGNNSLYNQGGKDFYLAKLALAPTGVTSQLAQQAATNVYPNPSNGLFTVEFGNANINQLKVLNQVGQEVYVLSIAKGQSKVELNLTQLPAGVYYLLLQGTETKAVQKIMLAH